MRRIAWLLALLLCLPLILAAPVLAEKNDKSDKDDKGEKGDKADKDGKKDPTLA